MSLIDEDFRTALVSLLPAGTTIEKGTISDERPTTRVYYQRSQANQDTHLNGDQGLTTTVFDVEVAALADDATAQSLAGTIKAALNGSRGVMGASSSALGVFVADHADDYQPRGVDADDGYCVAAFQVSVIHL